jgi:autotransporter-associated beta strand protein
MAVATLSAFAGPARAQTWTKNSGAGTTAWNTTTNWSPTTVPNSASAVVNFSSSASNIVGTVAISASVSSQSLNFSNSSGNYNITSNAGITLSSLSSINLTSAVTTVQTINLANVATGSLLYTGTLSITNNTNSALGSTLVIGPNTVIGTAASNTSGVVFQGSGSSQFTGAFASGAGQVVGGLEKAGPGTLSFTGSGVNLQGNTIQTGLTINGGTLVLDYSTSTASKLGAGAVNLEGGVLSLVANTGSGVTQTVSMGAVANSGHTDVVASSAGGGTLTLNVNALARSAGGGATMDISTGAGNPTFTVQTTTGNTNGLIGFGSAFATLNGGGTWATVSGSNVAAFNSYNTDAYSTPGANVDVVSPPVTPPNSIAINSLRFNTGNQTLTLAGSNTLQSGGVLVTPSATGATITGGTLSALNGIDLLFHTYGTGPLIINSSLISSAGLTKTGPGTLTLQAGNFGLTGPINVNRGGLAITTTAAVNSASAINFNDDRATTGGAGLQQFVVDVGPNTNGTINPPISVAAFSPNFFGTVFSTGVSTNSRVILNGVISSQNPTGGNLTLTTPIAFTGSASDTSGFSLGGTNTFIGTVNLNHGYLGVSADASLGNSNNAIILNNADTQNGGIEFLSGFSTSRAITVSNATRVLVDGNNNTTTLLGTLTSTGSGSSYLLVKAGNGTLDIAGDGNGFQGGMTLNGGTIQLDYSLSTTAKLAGGVLTLGGGTLQLIANSGTPVTQAVAGGTVVATGHTDVKASGTGTITLNAGAITQTIGGTVDFTLTTPPTFTVSTSTSNNPTGGLFGTGPAFATVNNGATWAVASGGNIAGLASFGTTFTSGINVDVAGSSSQSGITVNSLRFNSGNFTLTLSGTNTLQSGGVLVTPSAGAGTLSGGTLTANGELIFHAYHPLSVSSSLVSSVGLTKTGGSNLTLSGANTGLTGQVNINRGSLTVNGITAVNSASQINFNDTNAFQQFTILGSVGTINPPIHISTLTATGIGTQFLDTASPNSVVTLAGIISSPPGFSTPLDITTNGNIGNGFNLTASNTFTGPISLSKGSLGINSDASLGDPNNVLTLQVNSLADGGLVFLNSGINVAHAIAVGQSSRIVSNGTDSNTISGVISGTAGLYKAGTGTLSLTGTNTVTGGITVNGGTLIVTTSSGLPLGQTVLVGNSAVFNPTPVSTPAYSTVTLNGGTLRTAAGGSGITGADQIVSSLGGALDLSNTPNLRFQINNSITVNANATWTTSNGSYLYFPNNNETITIAPGAMLTNGIQLATTIFGAQGTVVNGGGTLFQNPNGLANTGITNQMTISGATYRFVGLSSQDFANGNLIVDGATLSYAGGGGTQGVSLKITSNGATYVVENAAATLVDSAPFVNGTGPFTKAGSGTLAFTGSALTNGFNSVTVSAGTLRTSNDIQLGTTAAPVTVSPLGTLEFTNTTVTSRTITLNGGTMTVDAGQFLSLINATVGGGFLHGPGTFVVNGALLTGNSTSNNVVVNVVGAGSFSNFSNSGAMSLTQGPGVTATFSTFINQGSGSITMGAQSPLNVADFQSYGTLTITPATITENYSQTTKLTNVGTTPLAFNGGSRTFVGTPQTAVFPVSSPQAGQPTFVAGIDLNGINAVVAGGLFVNNGYVEDSSNGFTGTATIVSDFGSLVKGAGFFQNSVITQNGGKFQPGNSPGAASFGKLVLGPGGVASYVFAIDDATGTAGPTPDASGHVSGWGLVRAIARLTGAVTTPGDFTWTATPTDKLLVSLQTLLNPTTVGVDVPGPMDHFDPTRSYNWLAVEWSGSYAGPADPALLDASTAFDSTGFANRFAGTFGWSLDNADRTLSLTYTPSTVPEPGSLALAALAVGGFVMRVRRQSRLCTFGPSTERERR